MKMTENKKVSTYITRITQVHDDLSTVGESILNGEMVRTILSGFSEKWKSFVKCVVSKEHSPNSERLWDEFIQEETREEALRSRQSKGEENDENIVLFVNKKEKKAKGGEKYYNGGKKDMSKVIFYASHELGHYGG